MTTTDESTVDERMRAGIAGAITVSDAAVIGARPLRAESALRFLQRLTEGPRGDLWRDAIARAADENRGEADAAGEHRSE